MKSAALPLAAVLAAGITIAGASFLSAQDAAKGADPVIARVDGTEIRESDLALAEDDIGSGLQPSPPEVRRETLLTYLIDVTIIAKAAEAQKLAQTPGFERRAAFARQKVLMEALLDKESKGAANEAAMKKIYDDSVAQNKPVEEVRARHILVETEEKAKEVLAKLKAGSDFAVLAKAESKDTGSADGGDLGYFAKEQMVPEFSEAAFKLEKGALSEPVKTQFGWHIIKLEDKRNKPIPEYEQVKGQIESYVARRAQTELVGKLREAAKVERVGQKPTDTQQKK
ncbi:MAG TPA: peptidylprolyl isomerase [Xanthobacteraceae bacterium]|nr:peptidylprolyl isomerase [Xanthobacteraceae bacterium]